MLREQIVREWNGLKTKLTQLKAKSIDNYPKTRKIVLCSLRNKHLGTVSTTVADLRITNDSITKRLTNFAACRMVVDLMVEHLEVIILQDLTTADNRYLGNDDESLHIEEVD